MHNGSPGSDTADLLVFKGIQQGIAQRGAKENPELAKWGRATGRISIEKISGRDDPVPFETHLADLCHRRGGKYKMSSLEPALNAFLQKESMKDLPLNDELYDGIMAVKTEALRSLLKIDPEHSAGLALLLLK